MKVNLENLADMIHEYGELDEWEKMHVLDDVVEIVCDLHKNDITEGHFYETYVVMVEPEGEIPQPFKTHVVQSPMTNQIYSIDVKMIQEIIRGKDGRLCVTVFGRRKKEVS